MSLHSFVFDDVGWRASAYAFYKHGESHAALIAPEGRILLAGEHASLTHPWIQDAIESGPRAVTHIANSGA